jgi:Flp pilus assembly protein TadB
VTDPQHASRLLEQEERQEDVKERLEREHGELIQELRALIPGAEVLFGFLLAIRFTQRFEELDDSQRYVYYVTLVSTSAALVLYLATSAHHRLRFRTGDKEFALRKGNRDTIAGTVAAAVAFTGVMYLVTDLVFGTWQAIVAAIALFGFICWRWWAVALYRTWLDRRETRVS